MLRRTVLGLVASAALAVPAFAQTADELVAKNLAARGGLTKLKAVNTVRMTGTMSMGAMELPMVVEMKRPSNIRTEVTFQGSTSVQAFDGKNAWVVPPMGDKQPLILPSEAAKQAAAQADIDGPFVDYKAKGSQVELVGKEKVDGRDAYKLKLAHPDGTAESYFLDAGSYLVIRVEAKRTIQGQPIEGESTIGDYEESGGVLWPHSIQNVAKGRPESQTLTFEKIEVNPPVDDARFLTPANAKPAPASPNAPAK